MSMTSWQIGHSSSGAIDALFGKIKALRLMLCNDACSSVRFRFLSASSAMMQCGRSDPGIIEVGKTGKSL
jgi:hypothetical protein